MPVRLDQVPALAPRPARPRGWLWLGVLPLLLLLAGTAFLFGTQAWRQQSVSFWGLALGLPLLVWCLLGFARVLLYFGQQQVADGWDKAREEDLINKVRRGRRVQQVLAVSMHTALQEPGGFPAAQRDALLSGTSALVAQPSVPGGAALRQSRLSGDTDEGPEHLLLRVLTQVLADLAQPLTQLPDDTPLSLLLEVESGLAQNLLQRVWRQAWSESGIRQSTVPVEGGGLKALDQWLDHRIGDQALLLVVAFQFMPQQPEGTAEAMVGLLLGNRLTQSTLPSIACLHRPEQERQPTADALLHAARQSLDWVPLDAPSIKQTWRVAVAAQRDADVSSVMAAVPLPAKYSEGACNLDTVLGHPGKASPWLAIAAATQSIQCGAGPQFIFSGGYGVDTGLWSTVVTPVPPLSK
ncbi:hypothetical protein BOH74_23225 [Pseudomonas versuta]|uniref:Uncharacterized protein n=1 Tax=Pseudomonas versuta TaxID=1788301 RepID=A0A853ZV71_9PSED|nr:hypothetical protein [Pseudomonas versuta]OKA17162.1 hypothetical protein BOH74_23225 [Pseudomonas versuta]